MLTQIINGKIFTPQGWLDEGSVLIRDNKILEVTNCDLALIGAKLIDAKGMYIVPGYVCMPIYIPLASINSADTADMVYTEMCVCMLMAVVVTILMNVRKRRFAQL